MAQTHNGRSRLVKVHLCKHVTVGDAVVSRLPVSFWPAAEKQYHVRSIRLSSSHVAYCAITHQFTFKSISPLFLTRLQWLHTATDERDRPAATTSGQHRKPTIHISVATLPQSTRLSL